MIEKVGIVKPTLLRRWRMDGKEAVQAAAYVGGQPIARAVQRMALRSDKA